MQNNPPSNIPNNANIGTQNALKDFQLSGNATDKKSIEYGKKILLQVEEILKSSYFSNRNIRFDLNRSMYAGRMDMNKFKDFLNVNGVTNYININWKSIMIVNTIVSRLVGRWMTKKIKAAVTAVDDTSIKQKKAMVDEADFYMSNKDQLNQLTEQSGVQMIPPEQFIPDDKDHLDLWAQDELRVPEEILMEVGINNVFDENGWGDMGVNTRAHKIDAAVVGFVGSETIADKNGKIHVKYLKPENCFHSYSERDDLQDASIKGVIESYKLSDIRSQYPNIKTEVLYNIAKTSKQWQYNDKLKFDTSWNTGMNLPFDDWNVDVVRFTIKTLDTDKTLIKTGKDGRMYVDRPKKKIDEVYEGNEYVEKTIWTIYRGVYVRQINEVLEWGVEKNMIRPQEDEKIYEAQSPFSFYMYQNVKMRNLAVPEKIEEPVEMMILTRLKIQQLIALLRPSGYQYDIDGLQEMDLGNGIVKPLELRRITDQTGDVYFRGRDTEGNRIENPIRENPNAGSTAQLQQLIETYNYHLQVLRDEIGINEFAEGQTIKPRTGVENVNTALDISFNATDYMNEATIFCLDESADKVACLLHDSIEYGSKEYRDLMGEKDVENRNFKTKIEMLPTIEEVTQFDATVNNAINAQPDLVLYLNPEKIKRIAKKNVKLGENYWRQGQKRAIEGRAKQAQQQSQMNADAQKESGLAVEAAKQQSLQMELQVKTQIETATSKEKQKEVILTGIFGIYQKGVPMPPELLALTQEIIQNVGLPLFAENIQNAQDLQQGMQQQQEAAAQEQQQEPPMQEQPPVQ